MNFGQNVIFSVALSAAMVLCSNKILSGEMTVGDLVGFVFHMLTSFISGFELIIRVILVCSGYGKWASFPAISSTQFSWRCIS